MERKPAVGATVDCPSLGFFVPFVVGEPSS